MWSGPSIAQRALELATRVAADPDLETWCQPEIGRLATAPCAENQIAAASGDACPFRLEASTSSNALEHDALGLPLGIEVVEAWVCRPDNASTDMPVGLDASQPAIAALTARTAVTIANLLMPA